jgi:hypothetical protein
MTPEVAEERPRSQFPGGNSRVASKAAEGEAVSCACNGPRASAERFRFGPSEAKQEGYLQYVTVNVDGQYHTTIIFDADGYGGAAGQELVTLQNVHYSQLYESHFAL